MPGMQGLCMDDWRTLKSFPGLRGDWQGQTSIQHNYLGCRYERQDQIQLLCSLLWCGKSAGKGAYETSIYSLQLKDSVQARSYPCAFPYNFLISSYIDWKHTQQAQLYRLVAGTLSGPWQYKEVDICFVTHPGRLFCTVAGPTDSVDLKKSLPAGLMSPPGKFLMWMGITDLTPNMKDYVSAGLIWFLMSVNLFAVISHLLWPQYYYVNPEILHMLYFLYKVGNGKLVHVMFLKDTPFNAKD